MLFHLYVLGKVSKKRLLGTARVLAYGVVVSTGLGALTIRSAIADVKQESLELGRKLEGVQDMVKGAQEYKLNGQSVFFATSRTPEPLSVVLDRFQSHCEQAKAFEPLEWKDLTQAGNGVALPPPPPEMGMDGHFGVVRTQDAAHHDGVVLCFTDNHQKSFLAAVQAFGQSGDLHDLGNLRYVHAVHKDNTTYIQTIWTDGSFNIRALTELSERDAVGSDFAALPRPIQSIRRLTAEGVGTPYAARIYDSTAAPDEVLKTYQASMEAQGWQWATSPDVSLSKNGLDGRWFIRPETGEQAVVSVSRKGGSTSVMVASVAMADISPRNVRPQ